MKNTPSWINTILFIILIVAISWVGWNLNNYFHNFNAIPTETQIISGNVPLKIELSDSTISLFEKILGYHQQPPTIIIKPIGQDTIIRFDTIYVGLDSLNGEFPSGMAVLKYNGNKKINVIGFYGGFVDSNGVAYGKTAEYVYNIPYGSQFELTMKDSIPLLVYKKNIIFTPKIGIGAYTEYENLSKVKGSVYFGLEIERYPFEIETRIYNNQIGIYGTYNLNKFVF